MSQFAGRREKMATISVVLVSAGIALASARGHVGSWNDASRLATVESLVNHGTWAIDESIFVEGTCDKLFIDGHFYSDKSPVPALLLALVYGCCQALFGLCAHSQPETFCYLMTVAACGVPYVIAVLAIFKLGRILGLASWPRLLLTGSFALATIAVVYVCQVNNHLPLLSVAAVLMLAQTALAKTALGACPASIHKLHVAAIGFLAGLGYCIDLGTGPLLLACSGLLTAWRCRRAHLVALFILAALPWLACHHAINYIVGGTWRPANAVPEYFQWPGSPFTANDITGTWHHPGFFRFLEYAAALLFGEHGFVGHNLPLFLLAPAATVLLRLRPQEWPELLFASIYCAATWLVYAALSNNYAGQCCSVRWFLPMLAPAYFVLAVLLKYAPAYREDLLLLTAWGVVIAGLSWYDGPWNGRLVPGYWIIQGSAVATWAFLAGRRWWSGSVPGGPR